ncbi:hypothetical protein VTL71DRAFT_2416 [Oculimacula yallundae]|uniref:DUF6546 domain-containing protein n=1 Tax=Oculimacula yallundae TaxID=86028 RepID=A0ABR4C8U4_9HELO
MTSWHRFPAEIRLAILELLLQDGCSLATFATVSREWQTTIERHNFSWIKLTSSRVADFATIIHRNRHLVRYIWLCLELQEYDCTGCEPKDPELWGLSHTENVMITAAFHDLFSALSLWEPVDGTLLLDISVYSRSDSEHCFKYLTFEPDLTLDMRWQGPSVKQSMVVKSTTDHRHGVFQEIMGEGPFDDEEEEGQWWQQLPLVPAVTSVLLRRQTRRRWKPAALAHMFSRLPGLQEIHYEPWREWLDVQQRWTDTHFQHFFESLSIDRLRKLVLFEDFDQTTSYFPSRIPSSHVSRAVANASLNLEHLSASFIVDASQFFAAREPSWTWPNLTSLALTSRLLAPQDARHTELDNMLQSAAAAAMKMPNLETMEIWNGERGFAMLFRYQRIQAWDAVALRHSGQGHIVVKELLDTGVRVMSHGDAIDHLKLSQVIRPVSLRQIQMEHMVREGL